MSRRKQQNPKPLKYDLPSSLASKDLTELNDVEFRNDTPSSPSRSDETLSGKSTDACTPPPQPVEEQTIHVKDEPKSPASLPLTESAEQANTEITLESLLGIPDDAPLRVESCENGGYKILTSKKINKNAGLDPLKAQLLENPDSQRNNSQLVSFSHSDGKVYFVLDSSINCGWLKHLGAPSDTVDANLRIYYVGGQLWVEVIKNLSENEQLIAEFFKVDKKKGEGQTSQDTLKLPTVLSSAAPATSKSDPYPCNLCGVTFRNPNTLMAHRKHYCSKLPINNNNTPTTSEKPPASVSPPSLSVDQSDSENFQSAYICQVCKYMTLTKADIEMHIREKHKNSVEINGEVNVGSDKTFCSDCEIHFKKPDSYIAHKLHYCKSRSTSTSPRPESTQSQNPQSQHNSPSPAKVLYKKVSFFDNHSILASQAAAAAAVGLTFPFTSLLTMPTMASLPMMPLKLLQSPAMFVQALQSAAKANTTTGSLVNPTTSTKFETETPLDLSVKQELMFGLKRKADSDSELSPPMKKKPVTTISASSASPSSSLSTGLPLVNGHAKMAKSERPIYRCESCSIPFYKKDVYQAHKLHYCSQKSSSNSEMEEESTTPNTNDTQAADDRLVITYTCNKCSTSYRTIETFKAHQCSLPQNIPELNACDECNFTTTTKQLLQEHMETHQKNNNIFKCLLCGYHGNTMRGMRQHGRQHMLKGEDFSDSDVTVMETLPAAPQKITYSVSSVPSNQNSIVDEELLRLKNEPYKKRRSRKHYQKSEYSNSFIGNGSLSPQRKENVIHRPSSVGSQSNSTHSCTSPLQTSATNITYNDDSQLSSPGSIKHEPAEVSPLPTQIPLKSHVIERKATPTLPIKNHICACNASFASAATFEAHKKHYCPFKKAKQSNTPITVTH